MSGLRPALVALALLPTLAAAQGGAAERDHPAPPVPGGVAASLPVSEAERVLPPPPGEGRGGGRTSSGSGAVGAVAPLPASPSRGEGTESVPPRPIAPPRPSAGRGGAEPWATLTPAVGVGAPLGGGYGPSWTDGAALAVRVEVPAYGGRVRAEVRAAGYASAAEGVPSFSTLTPTVGWGPAVRVGPVRVGGGARVGVVRFQIDDDEAGRLQSETELTAGGWAGAAVRWGRVEVWAEADGARVALSDPVTLWTVGGGLAVRLDAPGWLRGVLR